VYKAISALPWHGSTSLFAVAIVAFLLSSIDARAVVAQETRTWQDERTAGPFLCHADFSLEEHVDLLDDVNRLQDDLLQMLGVQEAQEPIHLLLFARKATYDQYLRVYFPEVPRRRALYIKARGPGMVFAYQSNEFAVDARHECTHALLHASLPMVPLWLDEGLAEYFEVPSESRADAHPHLKRITWRVRFGQVPKLPQLEALAELSQMTQTHYQQSWAWVHFMLHGPPEAGEELRHYLADIAARTPPGKLSERLERRLPDLESQFRDHFLNER